MGTFTGTLVVVSHDRAFLDALDLTRTVSLGPAGNGHGSDGDPGLPLEAGGSDRRSR